MARAPYSGTCRKLVLESDIGTTYSGPACAFLDPGEVPEITLGQRRSPASDCQCDFGWWVTLENRSVAIIRLDIPRPVVGRYNLTSPENLQGRKYLR